MSSNTHPSDEIVADDMSIPAQAKPRHHDVMMTGQGLKCAQSKAGYSANKLPCINRRLT
jgi:hypothetical protein